MASSQGPIASGHRPQSPTVLHKPVSNGIGCLAARPDTTVMWVKPVLPVNVTFSPASHIGLVDNQHHKTDDYYWSPGLHLIASIAETSPSRVEYKWIFLGFDSTLRSVQHYPESFGHYHLDTPDHISTACSASTILRD